MGNQAKSYDLIAAAFSDMRDSFHKEQKYINLLIQV